MSSSGNDTSLSAIGDFLQSVGKVAVLSHMRPDGDAIGSAVALGHALAELGKEVTIVNQDGVPESLLFLPQSSLVNVPSDIQEPLAVEATVVLDTAGEDRVGQPVWDVFSDRGKVINIDHHISNPAYGDINYIDADASATGEIVFDLIQEMKLPVDEVVRDNLWAGISTDTGSFRYPKTSEHTFEIAASLMRSGVDVGGISQSLYETYPLRRIYVLRELLQNMQMTSGDRVASWQLTNAVKDELGIDPSDTEGLIDVIRSVDSVIVAVFFEELRDGKIRISARSKTPDADVGAICGEFGGGGHQLAAGARMKGPIEDAVEQFLKRVDESLNG